MKRITHFIPAVILLFLFAACQSNTTSEKAENTSVSDTAKTDTSQLARLRQEIRNDPNSSDPYYKRGLYYKDHGNLVAAIEDMKRALQIDSTVSVYHSELGELYYVKNEVDKARAELQKAINYDNQNTDALLGLAEINLVLQKYDKSMDLVNEALKIDEHLYKGYFLKGYIYKETGDTSKAISSFQTTVEVNPNYFPGFMELGVMNQNKDNGISLDYYNTALKLKPNDPEALTDKALYLQEHKAPRKAMGIYKKLLASDSSNTIAWYNTGYVYLGKLNMPDSALPYFEKACQLYPKYFEAFYNKGLCNEKLGHKKEAIADYKKSLQINPQYDLAAKGLERLIEGSDR